MRERIRLEALAAIVAILVCIALVVWAMSPGEIEGNGLASQLSVSLIISGIATYIGVFLFKKIKELKK